MDDQCNYQTVHSLGSCDFLKIQDSNYLFFSCQRHSNRIIRVEEQF